MGEGDEDQDDEDARAILTALLILAGALRERGIWVQVVDLRQGE